jgi:RimJ/RimL family protein N-acetyltransferase
MTDLGWRLRPITREDAEAIAQWRYPEPYSLYDSSPDDVDELLDPANDYFVAVDASGEVVGHGCFGMDARVPGYDYDDNAIDWGLGMRPDLTGQGHGVSFMQLVCDEARRRWPGRKLRTTVATFNERSASVVRKLGFSEVAIFRNAPGREFVVYVGD